MNKPDEILRIEEIYGIKIEEFDIKNPSPPEHNFYKLDKKNNVVSLNLSYNGITEIQCLEPLQQLTDLDLADNQITEIKGLESLKKLTKLELDSNQITEIKGLESLKNLTKLDLGYNQITEIKGLELLKKLRKLDLRRNQITKIQCLEPLQQLTELCLFSNKITEIEGLESLEKLADLDLGDNQITEIKGLKSLKKLTQLKLDNNQITEIKCLEPLQQLIELHLSQNQITEIKGLQSLQKLSKLFLQENQIKEIKELESLQLTVLYFSDNQIYDITTLLKMNSLKDVSFRNNSKIEIDYPKEVLRAGWEAIKQFSEKSKEKIIFSNVKVLLLGNPNIGKTNLLEYLETNQKPISENSTHGVQHKKIDINNINFHIWDFGGQEYFHATHQLFFSNNAINIILWGKDIARENITEKCFGVDYWLRIIQQLNGDNEEIVFLTENKIDLNIPKYSEKHIANKFENTFPNLRFFENHISLADLKNLNGYKEKLIDISEQIISRFKYPQFYEVFWRRIESLNKDYATIQDINNRPHTEHVIPAMKVFHNMGMLLYFHDILPDKVFVKPQILLELLYQKVLNNSKKYKITKQEIAQSIKNNTLDLNENEIIVLLKHFNLVFEVDEEKDCYFIPQYLPEQSKTQKYFENLGSSFCNIKIKADHYLVSLAMLKLFAIYGKFVDKEKGVYQFWKDGIVINKDNENILIKYDVENQLIKLYPKNSNDRKLQKEIVDFILVLPENITLPKRNLENYSDEYQWNSNYFTVSVSFDGEFFAEWNQLNNNSNLKEINFENIKGEQKKITIKDYYFYINKEKPKNQNMKNRPIIIKNSKNFQIGNQTKMNIYENHYLNNPDLLKSEEILKEFQQLKIENEEWKNIFIEGMKDLIELKEAETEFTIQESKTTLRKWHDTVFDLGKRLNDWKNITFLGVDFVEKTPKLLNLLHHVSQILN